MSIIPNFTDGAWKLVSTDHVGGDLNSDILWQKIADQSLILWQQDGATTVQSVTLPSLDGYLVAAVGDFDGDGIGDPLLREGSSNKLLLSTTGTVVNTDNDGANRVVINAMDLTGSGTSDLVSYNQTTGQIITREYDGPNVVNQVFFQSSYTAADQFLAAYNGTALDSFASLWRNNTTNQYEITTYTNGAKQVSDTFTVASGREFVSKGDYDGDGNADFLFIDPDGFGVGDVELVFSEDSGTEIGRIDYDADLFFGIDFRAGGDFDGDGRFELLSVDPVDGGLSVFNAIGGDQFSRDYAGGDRADMIDGQAGNDEIFGLGGDDLLLGGAGRDNIVAGEGNDRVSGGDDDDSIIGGVGDDILKGGSGNDWIVGGAGADMLEAGNGTDFLFGDDGDDYLVGGSFGFDHMRGGVGNDTILGGSDRTLSEGGDGDDIMIGSSSNDTMFGGNGNDYIVGGLSQDTIYGGAGDDIIIGVDVAGTSGTDDFAYGGSGSDYFYLGNDDGNYYTGSGELYIYDFSTSLTFGDFLMLNGNASNYDFVDVGASIQVRQSSDANVLAIIETTAAATAVEAKAIYIG